MKGKQKSATLAAPKKPTVSTALDKSAIQTMKWKHRPPYPIAKPGWTYTGDLVVRKASTRTHQALFDDYGLWNRFVGPEYGDTVLF